MKRSDANLCEAVPPQHCWHYQCPRKSEQFVRAHSRLTAIVWWLSAVRIDRSSSKTFFPMSSWPVAGLNEWNQFNQWVCSRQNCWKTNKAYSEQLIVIQVQRIYYSKCHFCALIKSPWTIQYHLGDVSHIPKRSLERTRRCRWYDTTKRIHIFAGQQSNSAAIFGAQQILLGIEVDLVTFEPQGSCLSLSMCVSVRFTVTPWSFCLAQKFQCDRCWWIQLLASQDFLHCQAMWYLVHGTDKVNVANSAKLTYHELFSLCVGWSLRVRLSLDQHNMYSIGCLRKSGTIVPPCWCALYFFRRWCVTSVLLDFQWRRPYLADWSTRLNKFSANTMSIWCVGRISVVDKTTKHSTRWLIAFDFRLSVRLDIIKLRFLVSSTRPKI